MTNTTITHTAVINVRIDGHTGDVLAERTARALAVSRMQTTLKVAKRLQAN